MSVQYERIHPSQETDEYMQRLQHNKVSLVSKNQIQPLTMSTSPSERVAQIWQVTCMVASMIMEVESRLQRDVVFVKRRGREIKMMWDLNSL